MPGLRRRCGDDRLADRPGRRGPRARLPLGHGHPQSGAAQGHPHQGGHHRKPLQKILRGPAGLDDGTQNLLGCIRTSMGTLGARSLKEMRQVEVVVAPSLLTEGKVYQKAQQLGMGK